MEFHNRLKTLRTQASMTQQQLGKAIGVSQVTIRNWETGAKMPSMAAIISLSKVFGTSSDFILGIKTDDRLQGAPTTREEARLLSEFRELDRCGKKTVSMICSLERARVMEESKKKIVSLAEHISQKFIPKYSTPSAAGYSAPIDGEEYEMILVDERVPDEADFAIEASGNSMEPYIYDGETLYVKKDSDLDIGDVGIFIVNGARYCKQYFIDGHRNMTLVSANPELQESNIYISAESDATVICCGKVLLPFETPLPSYFTEE